MGRRRERVEGRARRRSGARVRPVVALAPLRIAHPFFKPLLCFGSEVVTASVHWWERGRKGGGVRARPICPHCSCRCSFLPSSPTPSGHSCSPSASCRLLRLTTPTLRTEVRRIEVRALLGLAPRVAAPSLFSPRPHPAAPPPRPDSLRARSDLSITNLFIVIFYICLQFLVPQFKFPGL